MKHAPIAALLLFALPAFAADPSLVPLQDVTGQKPFVERWRIRADLDQDGHEDLLLSGGPATFGKAGGAWFVYLHRDGAFRKVGDLSAHPKAIAIEPDQDRHRKDPDQRRYARIWVYLRGSGRAGAFGYFRVGEKSVDPFAHLEIYPGDGGTSLGNALYESAFRKSPLAFTLERSTTDADGTVRWSVAE